MGSSITDQVTVTDAVAVGDTWGISGPTFLWIFAGMFVVTCGLVWLTRRALGAKAEQPVRSIDDLRLEEVAMLQGGASPAVLTALLSLWQAGIVDVRNDAVNGLGADPRRLRKATIRDARSLSEATNLVSTGQVPPSASALEREVCTAIAEHPFPQVGEIRSVVESGPAVKDLEAGLVDRGLLRSAAGRRQVRLASMWFVALLGLGIVRAVVGSSRGKGVGYLVLMLVAVGLALLVSLRVARLTPRGTRLLRRGMRSGRDRRAEVAEAMGEGRSHPNEPWAYALYGDTFLWASAPAVALSLGVMPMAASTSGFSSWGGSSYGGGACGGGGGGGGSSCGGGGGCGGGGCGG